MQVLLWLWFYSELDNTGVVDDPDDFMPEYPSMDLDVTDEMIEQANDKRSEAMQAMGDGNYMYKEFD